MYIKALFSGESLPTYSTLKWFLSSMSAKMFINTLRPRQNGRHFADDISKWILLKENVWFSIKISLKFVPKGQINNIPALVQIMAWRRPGDKPLSEPMTVSLLTHICVTWPQWIKSWFSWKLFLAHGTLIWLIPRVNAVTCLMGILVGRILVTCCYISRHFLSLWQGWTDRCLETTR